MDKNNTDPVIAPGHPSIPVDPALLEPSTAALPPKPGLRTTKSHCCNATVVTVGKGILRQVCLVCGKDHHEHVYR